MIDLKSFAKILAEECGQDCLAWKIIAQAFEFVLLYNWNDIQNEWDPKLSNQ